MRFARIGAAGHERPVVVDEGGLYDLSPITADIDGAFLSGAGVERARRALEVGELTRVADSGAERWGCPIARPHAVFCIGLNYAAHAAESKAPTPSEPVLFLKTPNSLGGPDDDIVLPR